MRTAKQNALTYKDKPYQWLKKSGNATRREITDYQILLSKI